MILGNRFLCRNNLQGCPAMWKDSYAGVGIRTSRVQNGLTESWVISKAVSLSSSWFSDHTDRLWLSGLKRALSHPWLHNWARCSHTCLHRSVCLFCLVWNRVHFSLEYKWWGKRKQTNVFNARRSLPSLLSWYMQLWGWTVGLLTS